MHSVLRGVYVCLKCRQPLRSATLDRNRILLLVSFFTSVSLSRPVSFRVPFLNIPVWLRASDSMFGCVSIFCVYFMVNQRLTDSLTD